MCDAIMTVQHFSESNDKRDYSPGGKFGMALKRIGGELVSLRLA